MQEEILCGSWNDSAKGPQEVEGIIKSYLSVVTKRVPVSFVIPVQWGWGMFNVSDIMLRLNRDISITSRFRLACSMSMKGIALTATPC